MKSHLISTPPTISESQLIEATSDDPPLILLKQRLMNEQHDPKLTSAFDKILKNYQSHVLSFTTVRPPCHYTTISSTSRHHTRT